ncbi:Ketoreductase azaE [Colletotrichum viniferum]|nr:Ketoreductase azaE [Colletotrichum viniferum]
MIKVLVTGGTGFVAGHVIDVLLQRGHSVLTTARSQEKAMAIHGSFKDVPKSKLETIVVPDIAAKGAFSALSTHSLEAVVHVASPFHYNVTDPKKDLIDPAVLGTTGVLHAIKESCPGVKRVVVTSSFAAILNPGLAASGAEKIYSEEDWSPLTIEDALPPKTLADVNTSNQLLAELVTGKHKGGLPSTALPLWVDVRDVALAHVKAMEIDQAAGKRFFVTSGFYSNAEMGKIVWDDFPDLREKLPGLDVMGGAPNPNLKSFGYNTSRAEEILGMK